MSFAAQICLGGDEFTIVVDGKRFQFEWHPYCGPMPMNTRGRQLFLGPRHLFWYAVSEWHHLGYPILPDGTCAWLPHDPHPGQRRVHMGGRHYKLVPL